MATLRSRVSSVSCCLWILLAHRWCHRWTAAGAGATIGASDLAVCRGGGTWHPGGVAVATTFKLRTAASTGAIQTGDEQEERGSAAAVEAAAAVRHIHAHAP
eukprot:COSAG01_NODE_193_length_22433_cov_91.669114_20_plen_102_part_00